MTKSVSTRSAFARLVAAGLAALAMSQASAQSLGDIDPPAEFPPSSFEGRQYVDSRGCVYIRAGIDGNTTWVPRVTRTREHVCGQTPTFAGAAPADTAPADTAVAEAPATDLPQVQAEEAGDPPTPISSTKPVSRPATEVTAAPAVSPELRAELEAEPAEAPRAVSAAPLPRAVKGAPGMTGMTVRAAAPSQGAPSSRGVKYTMRTSTHPGGPGVVARPGASSVLVGGNGYSVAVAESANVPVNSGTVMVRGTGYQVVRKAVPADAGRRVLPRHLYEDPTRDRTGLSVPDGYRKAWDDGRTNPRRAEQSVAGLVHSGLVWTRTVPRRLIDPATGRDMSAQYPTLYFPFTDVAMQRTYAADPDGYEVRMSTRGTVRLVKKSRPATVSTRSAAPQAAKPVAQSQPRTVRAAPAGHRYVQIGTFGDAANARSSIRRVQGLGLPAASQTIRRNGQALKVILAGPFTSSADVSRALAKVHGAGYRDAFTR